ncbi:putative restriction endonuclease [Thermus phage phiLo]|nr:putative restriction endonuclease [Thermus phage phiLo]
MTQGGKQWIAFIDPHGLRFAEGGFSDPKIQLYSTLEKLGEKDGKRVAIVWRPLEGLEGDEEALMRDKAFIEGTVLPALLGEAKPDRLLVNGASFVKDAEAIEPEFHRLMFAPVGV